MASIKQRPNGSWRARYRDASGREHAKHFPLKRDAQAWLDEVTASVITGQYADPQAGRITWAKFIEGWTARQTWALSTQETAHTALALVPWAQTRMRDIKPSHVQAWVAGEVKRGLAPATIKTRLNFAQMAFRAAVLDKVIPTNPAATVKPPRASRDTSVKVLTVEQLRAALAAAGDFEGFVAVCAFAGLRLGEAAGLQLQDLDFLRRTINVNRQIQGATNKSAQLVPPKYGSERAVFVPEDLMKMLSAHVKAQGLARPDDQLFRTSLGRLWHRNNAADEWRRVRTAAGLPEDLTLHSLRHTFASNLIASGCDVVTVQRALGHSQPSITLNVYSHLWPSAEDKTRSATADFMGSVLDSADSVRTGTTKPQVRGLV